MIGPAWPQSNEERGGAPSASASYTLILPSTHTSMRYHQWNSLFHPLCLVSFTQTPSLSHSYRTSLSLSLSCFSLLNASTRWVVICTNGEHEPTHQAHMAVIWWAPPPWGLNNYGSGACNVSGFSVLHRCLQPHPPPVRGPNKFFLTSSP